MSKFEWQKMDIVMFNKELYSGVTRNWFGYISDPDIKLDGSIQVKWYDDEIEYWTAPQSVPAGALTFLWRVV